MKILSVDDSQTIRMLVARALTPFNCTLLQAGNGAEGLAVAAREHPDLILLDVSMPVMNGVEMLAKLKDDPTLRDTPVIMLTAESSPNNVVAICEMGITDYLVKPFADETLVAKVRKVFPSAA